MAVNPQDVLAELLESRKYSSLTPMLLQRISADAASKERKLKLAVKRAKRALHQAQGAYVTGSRNTDWLDVLTDELSQAADSIQLQSVCRKVLSGHASTTERMDGLETIYDELFQITGTPKHILDLGCGAHPFALPWMNLPDLKEYIALDVDSELIAAINLLFRRLQLPECATGCDLGSSANLPSSELVFCLKTLPLLEHQHAGSARRLIRRLDCRWLIVSWPLHSLGGQTWGMKQNNHRIAMDLLQPLNASIRELEGPGEMFYIVGPLELRHTHDS